MEEIKILDLSGNVLNIELLFSFTCKENNKNYVALRNKNSIFERNSRYANIDIFEIVKMSNKKLYVSDVLEEDWELIKSSLQFDVFAKIK